MEPQGLTEPHAQTRDPVRFTSAVARGLRESAIIAIGVVALVLFVALVTYSPHDPAFSTTGDSYTGSTPGVRNRIGPIGAWLADVLFYLFGRPAFLLPVMLAVVCWTLHRRDRSEQSS